MIPVDPSLPVGTIVAAEVDGASMAVVHSGAGWVMVHDFCPHAGCPFTDDGEVVDGSTLTCNCHGSEFDLRTGQATLGPADDALFLTHLRADADGLSVEAEPG